MSKSRIRKIFESRLKTWADARGISVAWDNTHYDPERILYLSSHLLPAPTVSDDLKGDHRLYSGVYQVSVHGVAREGPGASEAVAELIQELYPLNIRLTADGLTVQIITPASIGIAIQETALYTVPVSFQYRADTI